MKKTELTRAVYELLDAQDSKHVAKAIAAYLLETRQSKEVGSLLRDLESLRLRKDGVLEVTVTTARPTSDTVIKDIKSLFDARKVIVHSEQDPSIIGGVKVRAHDRRLDYSVRTRLQRLKTSV